MPKSRKSSTAGVSESETAEAPSQTTGEAPGSPAYFGELAGERDSTSETAPDFETMPDTGIGTPPGSAAYWGADAVSPAASAGPEGGAALSLPTVGEEPGSASYFGTTEGVAGTTTSSAESEGGELGDEPGSPAYFGESGGAEFSAAETTPDFATVPYTGIGAPPGSAEYWGAEAATHDASRGLEGGGVPLPTVGEEPGSPSYFGTEGDA